jgi:hypothetical protein
MVEKQETIKNSTSLSRQKTRRYSPTQVSLDCVTMERSSVTVRDRAVDYLQLLCITKIRLRT